MPRFPPRFSNCLVAILWQPIGCVKQLAGGIAIDDGWQEVADTALTFIRRFA